MKTSSLFSVILCSLLIVGCHNSVDSINGTTSIGVIIPLAQNNLWIYEQTITDSLGRIISGPSTAASTIDTSASINGSLWYDFSSFMPLGGVQYFQNRSDGLWVMWSGRSLLFFPYPASAGYEFTVFSDTSITDSVIIFFNMKVLSTNEQIITKKGSLACYHYLLVTEEINPFTNQHVATTNGSEVWCAPNIGIVKEVGGTGYNGYPTVATLVDYRLY